MTISKDGWKLKTCYIVSYGVMTHQNAVNDAIQSILDSDGEIVDIKFSSAMSEVESSGVTEMLATVIIYNVFPTRDPF
jgi:hypothetical protein